MTWKTHLKNVMNKAYRAFWNSNGASGKTWGLKHRVVHCIYTVIRPVLIYGSRFGGRGPDTMSAGQRAVKWQSLACLAVLGVMKTTPTTAMEVLVWQMQADTWNSHICSLRIWPNQNSGTWVIHHFMKPGDCDDISVSRILHFVQDVRLPNVWARGLHKRWIMVNVHGSFSVCSVVFYSIQFYTHCTDNTMTFITDVEIYTFQPL